MPLKVNIADPATGRRVPIDAEGAMSVQERSGPPFDVDERIIPFSSYLVDANGSRDMSVVGTPAAPAIFSLDALPDADVYVSTLQWVISALSMEFNDFGNGAALADPCILSYKTETRTVILNDQLARNSDFVLMAQGQPAFGSLTDAFKGSNPAQGNNTDDAYFPSLDVVKVYRLPWGIKIPAAKSVGLSMSVRDDATAATVFTCQAFGFIRFPDIGTLAPTG